jgi:hypothetical protein
VDEKGVDSFIVWFKAPGGDAFFLYGEKLGKSDISWFRVRRIL